MVAGYRQARLSALPSPYPAQDPPIPLVGSAFRAWPAHLRQALLLSELRAALDTLRTLGVMRTGLGGWATPYGQPYDIDFGGCSLDAESNAVTNAKVVCWLGTLAIQVNLSAGDGLRRLRAGLEEPGAPEPLVEAVPGFGSHLPGQIVGNGKVLVRIVLIRLRALEVERYD